MTIKTFRGLLEDGTQERINLHTNTGKVGYQIVKFQIVSATPGAATAEHVVQIFKEKQTEPIPTAAGSGTINVSDQKLIAAAIVGNSTNISASYSAGSIIFDNETFNQDIYITHTDNAGSEACNYYIELEQIKLNDNESTMATLQSIRSRYESYTPAGPT
jgi:hypothetical protein